MTLPKTKKQSAIGALTQAMARRLRKSELQYHLQQRQLDTTGDKRKLKRRLIQSLPLDPCPPPSSDMDFINKKDVGNKLQHVDTSAHEGVTNSLEERQIQPEHTYILSVKAVSSPVIKSTGIGMVLQDEHHPETDLWSVQKYLDGIRCVFKGEYMALLMGIHYALQRGIRNLRVRLDRDVVILQCQGRYNIGSHGLRLLHQQVMHLQDRLDSLRISHVPKDYIMEATELALRALATGKNIDSADGSYDPMNSYLTHWSEISTDIISNKGGTDNTLPTPSLMRSFNQSHGNIDSTTHNCIATSPPIAVPSSFITSTNDSYRDNSQQFLFSSRSPPSSNTKGVHTVQDHPVIDPQRVYRLQFDANTLGNGIAGAGVVIYDDEKEEEIWCAWQYLGMGTCGNNASEYQALILGLQCAKALGIRRLRAQGDSKLVALQVSGRCKVPSGRFHNLWKRTHAVIREFEHFEVSHIPRKYNQRADWLANHAIFHEHSFGMNGAVP
jgi:ribonuclease HI